MGYKVKKKLYKLVFADEDMAGLEVVMTASSIARALEIQRMGSAAKTELEQTDALVRLTASALLEWNLEDDAGGPVPATYDGLAAQPGYFFWAVFNAWIEAATGVSGPLDGSSTSGESFPEGSIPMEPSSPSLSS